MSSWCFASRVTQHIGKTFIENPIPTFLMFTLQPVLVQVRKSWKKRFEALCSFRLDTLCANIHIQGLFVRLTRVEATNIFFFPFFAPLSHSTGRELLFVVTFSFSSAIFQRRRLRHCVHCNSFSYDYRSRVSFSCVEGNAHNTTFRFTGSQRKKKLRENGISVT